MYEGYTLRANRAQARLRGRERMGVPARPDAAVRALLGKGRNRPARTHAAVVAVWHVCTQATIASYFSSMSRTT